MKTKILSILIIIALFIFNSNAQIKVLSTGQTSVGASTVPTGYNVNVFGYKLIIGATGTSYNTLSFDNYPGDPRIWSSSGKVVFYNSNSSTFNDIQVRTCYQNSDADAKTNINPLSNSLNMVKKMRGVTFNWKNNNAPNQIAAKKSPDKLEYGLIAQEVEKVVPDLVITNDSLKGKMLSYTGIIPILIEAIKDLSEQVDSQKIQIEALKAKGPGLKSAQVATVANIANEPLATLAQNAPNPFNIATTINYYLPETVTQATINIYDLTGVQIKSNLITSKGNSSITINANELHPGIFIYNLITDGQEVASRRMVLTQ
jgi:hypothetical protein